MTGVACMSVVQSFRVCILFVIPNCNHTQSHDWSGKQHRVSRFPMTCGVSDSAFLLLEIAVSCVQTMKDTSEVCKLET